ncbi:IncP-type conjugal transfer protein TrbI [Agrobacterium tumefaciens]|uniref:IncP-type conjugal transfer protein TrbI n=1 Tax=Agrobacterium tumefaciens TaxID=358 RepID=A0AA44FBU4_AGRTU|nr:IncP-type conjugal transfer protein TrbI [Agrobacterium tumefaciens]NTB87809.1 IncP-type conjugal transfer protein TrbI [Agrobacterium tumefaciens]NTC32103.1 IncP-type conjugal transfer protein TrbI [Agrobacterium tumefaciens]
MSSIDLGSAEDAEERPKIRRLNRLPIFFFIGLIVILVVVVIWGMAQRGLIGNRGAQPEQSAGQPASDFADELKRNIGDGVNEPPRQDPLIITPGETPIERPEGVNPFQPGSRQRSTTQQPETALEPEADWRARLMREHQEALLREQNRQKLAAMQAQVNARNSPMAVDVGKVTQQQGIGQQGQGQANGLTSPNGTADLLSAAMRAAGAAPGGMADPNNQQGKISFLNKDIADAGYLPNQVVPQLSPFELKRGSVIPATLITGINSDLPGRITAQVRQHVYDSATGHRLLIPQGTKLFGRYDSEVSYGQSRALVVWTDIIFPDGATLQIGGMAGVDTQGYGGFKDKVNNHFWRVWGSAILVAAIGTGVDMALPESNRNAFGVSQNDPTDAARRNFAETFGRVADRTIDKNMNIQPTLEIRPGYQFNILVDQDIVFPGAYQAGYVER